MIGLVIIKLLLKFLWQYLSVNERSSKVKEDLERHIQCQKSVIQRQNHANILVTLFNPHELIKIVLQSSTKFNEIRLKNWDRARLKGPFHVFRHNASFFRQKFSSSIFLEFCDRMDVEKSQRVHPYSFFGI